MATALLIIDVQRGLVDALTETRRGELLGTLAELLHRARSSGTPVVYVRHNGSPDDLLPGTPAWEIAPEIAPHPAEPIVEKRFRDSFRDTNLADVLAGINADHLVVAGMQTEYCVDATLREADRRGFRVTLVEDAHATFAVDDATEEQIRAQVHRVARGVASVEPAAKVLTLSAQSA